MAQLRSVATYHGQPPDNGKARQCEAAVSKDTKTRKKGERCPNPPIHGGNVCPAHGAKARQVKESAQLRLARLVDPSINLIAGVVDPRTKDEKQRIREAGGIPFQVKTAQDVLDRNGYKGKQELDITSHQHVNLGELSEEHLRAILALKEQLSAKSPDKAAM